MFRLKVVSILVLVFLLVISQPILANEGEVFSDNESLTAVETSVEDEEVENTESAESQLLPIPEGLPDSFPYAKDEQVYNNFINSIRDSIRSYADNGFKELADYKVVSDHLKLPKWGKFLYDYMGKTPSAMPIGDITIPDVNGEVVVLKGENATKQWVQNHLIPIIEDELRASSSTYSCDVYVYKPSVPQPVDYLLNYIESNSDGVPNIDSSGFITSLGGIEVKYIYSETPFGDQDSGFQFEVHSIGANYGVQLNPKYVSALDAATQENSVYKVLYKDGGKVSLVKVYAQITTPKDLKDLDFSSKTIADMSIYDGLGVNILTGELVVPDSVDGLKLRSAGSYEENKLNKEEILLLSLKDDMVAVPYILREGVNFAGANLLTGLNIDISPILQGNEYVNLSNGQQENLLTYLSLDDMLNIQRGESLIFTMYTADERVPFPRLVAWLASDDATSYMSRDQANNFIKAIEKLYVDAGKKEEWRLLSDPLGIKTGGVNKILLSIALIILVLGGVGTVVFKFVLKGKLPLKQASGGKKKEQEQDNKGSSNNGGLLFNLDEGESDEE